MDQPQSLIIIFRELTDQETDSVLQSNSKISVVDLGFKIPAKLTEHLTKLDNQLIQVADSKLLNEILSFPLRKTSIGEVGDLLKYDETNLWYYHRLGTYFSLKPLIYQKMLVDNMKTEYKDVTIYSDFDEISNFYSEEPSIRLIVRDSNKNSSAQKPKLFAFLFFSILRGLASMFKSRKLKKKKNLIIVNDNHITENSAEKDSYNPYYFNLLKSGKTNSMGVLHLVTAPKPDKNKNFIRRNLQTSYASMSSDYVVTIQGIFNRKALRRIREYLDEIIEHRNLLQKELNIWERLFYNKIIEFNGSSKLYLFQYECFKRFFSQSNFDSISCISEHSSNERSILDAARSQGITTIGIQHGLVGIEGVSYGYLKEELKFKPIPDLTILWGSYYKEYLKNNSCYQDEDLVTLGQLKTDYISEVKAKSAPELGLNLDDNRPKILMATQPIPDIHLRSQVADDVIEVATSLPLCQFIFKLHPSEKHSYYQKKIDNKQASNILILKDEAELYQLIYTCDLVVTSYSAVGTEAIYFSKPLITIDPNNQDLANYAKDQVALKCRNSKELKEHIQDVLDGNVNFEDRYAHYIKERAFNIDGEVANRYLSFIYGLKKQ